MKPMLTALAMLGAACVTPAAFAQSADDIPAPAAITDAGVQAWVDQHLEADGWIIIGADSVAVAFGGPDGVAMLEDGTLRATIRHEYYEARELIGRTMRSQVQVRIFDCRRRMNRIVAMAMFSRSNLQGDAYSAENPSAEWQSPSDDSLYLSALNRVCAAPTEGEALN